MMHLEEKVEFEVAEMMASMEISDRSSIKYKKAKLFLIRLEKKS